MKKIEIYGLRIDREIVPGDDIAKLIITAAESNGVKILDGDIIVVCSKVVAKSENRIIFLESVKPSEEAIRIATATDKDPRLVELILRESREILKIERNNIITLTKHGIVGANAGIDQSNTGGTGRVVLLPIDPDTSAKNIRRRIKSELGIDTAVIVSDTYGRPFREGQINLAIGFAGICPYRDYRGLSDRDGYILRIKNIAIVDEIAAAAELVMGQSTENTPFAIVRGIEYSRCEDTSFKDIVMPKERWLFR
ncbi:MAG: coenzyme F420-0:L-glutamate ligase [Ignisphaera sp.]|nr:coenzyme F420-0:L-glutamate ligase [Ignisphaera sp.]MCX8168257.1 coenzyme F420-0:L-glutamate ligase [Ignisphaera sp.]MDW8084875.1 coenzyme F420-0:L-glutamate ligase [Ignisphaera sp.]